MILHVQARKEQESSTTAGPNYVVICINPAAAKALVYLFRFFIQANSHSV